MTSVDRIDHVYGNQYRIKTSRKYDFSETYKKLDIQHRQSNVGRIDNLYILQDFTVLVWLHQGRDIEKKIMKIPHCTEAVLLNIWQPPLCRIEYSENARRFKDSTTRKDLIHSNLISGDFNTLHFFAKVSRKI